LIYTYRIEGQGASGRRYNLPTFFFGDYNFELKLVGFSYLVKDQKILSRAWGGVNVSDEAYHCQAVSTPTQALAYEAEFGSLRYNPQRAEKTRHFFVTFFKNFNRRLRRNATFSQFESAPILWLSACDDDFAGEEPISQVTVFHIFSFWDGSQLQVVRELPILEVDIPAHSDSASESKYVTRGQTDK